MSNNRSFLKSYVSYPLQAALVFVIFIVFKMLPLAAASAVGGAIARTVGPSIRVSKRAALNLTQVFPDKSAAEIKILVADMWGNLGRTMGEYPHVARIDTTDASGPVEVIGGDIYDRMRDQGGPCIIFSGHFANWELLPASAAQRGLSTVLVYRAANNPMVDWVLHRRTDIAGASVAPKGTKGARILFKSMKQGKTLGILVDQKMNDGIAVPFFGRDAMTAPALAELALRFDCPVIPAHVVRTGGANFQVIVEEPLVVEKTGDKNHDVAVLMRQVNARMEDWVRDHPEQWLWVHNRWPG